MWHYPLSWATVAVLLGLATIATSPLRRAAKLLSPSSLGIMLLLAIFVFRPIRASPSDFDFYGLDASGGSEFAAETGLIAIAGFTVGCVSMSAFAHRRTRPVAVESGEFERELRPHAGARVVLLAVAGCLAYSAVILFKGGPTALTAALISGRGSAFGAANSSLPFILAMVSYLGSAASSVYIAFHRGKFGLLRLLPLLLAIGLAFLFNTSTGNRRALVPILLIPAAAWLYRSKRGLPVRGVLLGLLAVLFFISLPFVRSEGARKNVNVFSASSSYIAGAGGVSGVINSFLLSYDTEMYNYVSYVGPLLGSEIPYGHGQAAITETLVFPLPSSWAPELYSDRVLTDLFGGGCGEPDCPVPSAPGVLLLDFGWPGVLVGMVLLGIGMRRAEIGAWRSRKARGVLLGAILTGYTPIFMRTYSPEAAWWAVYYFVWCWLSLRVITYLPNGKPDAPVAAQPSRAPEKSLA